MLHIYDLPEDHLVQILECLDIKTRAVAELVCKQWKNLIEECLQPINFKLIIHRGENFIDYVCRDPDHKIKETIRLNTYDKVVGFLRKNSRAAAVCIETSSANNLATCLNILPEYFSFGNLEHLELQCEYGTLSSEQVASIGHDGLTRLKHLSICQGALGCAMDIREQTSPEPIDTWSIKQLFESCSHLETLFLNCICILDLTELTILPPSLKSMLMPKTQLSEDDLEAFVAGDGKQLEEFQLKNADSGQLRIICGGMKELRTLIIPIIYIDSANDIRVLKNLRNLETLNIGLSNANSDANDVMLEVLGHCPRIQQLDLTWCNLMDKALTQIPRLCPNIKDICVWNHNVNKPSGISDKTLEALTTLKNLRKLCLPLGEFTATGLVDFLRKCPTICYLDIDDAVGDIGLVVSEMIRKATENPNTKYKMMFIRFGVSSVQKPANLRINHR